MVSRLDGGGDGVAAAQAHALVAVDEQRGGLVAQLGLQPGAHAQQALVRALRRGQPRAHRLHGLLQVARLLHQPATQSRASSAPVTARAPYNHD